MNDNGVGRLSAASGAAFVVAMGVALFLPGAPPKAGESAAQIASSLAKHRGAVLAGVYIAGVAAVLGIWFFATVRAWLARAAADPGQQVASAAFGAGVLALALVLVGMLLFYGAAYKVAGDGQDAIVRALTDGGNAATALMKFPFALFVAGVSLVAYRRALLPRWFASLGGGAAALLVLSAVSLFADGEVTQFGGPLDLLGGGPGMVWVVALSVMLARSRAGEPAQAAGGPVARVAVSR